MALTVLQMQYIDCLVVHGFFVGGMFPVCTHCLFIRARQRAPLAMYHEMCFGGSWGPTYYAAVLMANRNEKQPDRKEFGPTN